MCTLHFILHLSLLSRGIWRRKKKENVQIIFTIKSISPTLSFAQTSPLCLRIPVQQNYTMRTAQTKCILCVQFEQDIFVNACTQINSHTQSWLMFFSWTRISTGTGFSVLTNKIYPYFSYQLVNTYTKCLFTRSVHFL